MKKGSTLICIALFCFACSTAHKKTIPKDSLLVSIDEGTNIALAISPDKSSLAFDLQGRIWTMSIEGGLAEPVTDPLGGCHAPHWSPDGEWITFHSYRDGNFHIWRVRPDGSDLEQLTRGLSDNREPYWAFDGKSICFSSDRNGSYDLMQLSLDSLSINPISSEEGHNEYYPAISHDDQSVCYVKDDTTLLINHLSKSSSPQLIYSGPSSLGTPSFHPSGDNIIVQGYHNSSTFWLSIDLETQQLDTVVCDQQDIFPFRPAWLNDEEFIYAADGKINKLNIRDGASEQIPFKVELEINRTPYPKREYSFQDTNSQKILGLRNPVIAPDGQSLLVTALGDLWRVYEDGRQEQLTDDPYVDLDPSFSSDGNTLAYVTDRSGKMNIWLMDLESGESRQLTQGNTDLLYPVWSPDNKSIAYLEATRMNRWGRATLNIVNVESGKTRQSSGQIFVPGVPNWSPDGKSIWMATLQPNSSRFREGKTQLMRIDVADNSAEFIQLPKDKYIASRGKDGPIWSPDGKFLALILDGQLHIQEMDEQQNPLGEPQRILDALASVPSWTADSKSILVLQTENLVKVSLDGQTRTIPFNKSWKPYIPSQKYIIQAARLFNGLDSLYQSDLDVWIENNQISKITPRVENYPADWKLIDAKAYTLMPGLFDMHVHQSEVCGEILGRTWLAYGVTSVREVGANPYDVIARKEAWESARRPGPRQFYTGGLTDGNRVYYGLANSVKNINQLDLVLQQAIDLKYDLIKTYVRMPDIWQKKVVAFAHEHGLPVSSHELYPAVSYATDAIEHLRGTSRRGYSLKQSRLQIAYGDVRNLLSQSGMIITPTLGLSRTIIPYLALKPDLLEDINYQTFISASDRASYESFIRARQQVDLKGQIFKMRNQQKFIHDLVSENGKVTAGTDAPFLPYGWGIHAELELYVDGGLSPFDALQSAGYHAAKALNVDRKLGSVEEGKIADLVLVEGDPLNNISDAREVKLVIKNGVPYGIEELREPKLP